MERLVFIERIAPKIGCRFRQDYLDGSLSRSEQMGFREHMTDCINCHAAVSNAIETDRALRRQLKLLRKNEA